jgi:hypothetical protein
MSAMTVRELIEVLRQMPLDLPIVICDRSQGDRAVVDAQKAVRADWPEYLDAPGGERDALLVD